MVRFFEEHSHATDQALALPNLTCIVTSAEKKLVDAVSEAIQRVADGTAVGGKSDLAAAFQRASAQLRQ